MRKNVGSEGIYEIQFWDEYRHRKTITLSGRKYSERTAIGLRDAVKTLVYEKINDVAVPHRRTQEWIEAAPLEIRKKLAKFGLCQMSSRHTVKELWDLFLDRYEFKTESTRKTYLHARERFALFFRNPNELIVKLTKDRIEEWKVFLLATGKFGVPTIAGTIQKTKAVFNWAKSQKWITVSPLAGVHGGSFRNPTKDRVVTMSEYHQLLDACPNQEWRVIITLARIGGLRPCEIMVLRWSDIDEYKHRDRFHVFSPKLNPHEHLRDREVPLFAEVLTELHKLRLMPGNEGQEYIINRYSNREKVNLVEPFTTIATRAGIGKIVRPFDNMRASRSTEVHREYGAKAESVWIGHSEKIAMECYLMVMDEDYAAAAGRRVIGSVAKAEPEHLPEVAQGQNLAF